jgi:hypothetical protein
MMLNHNKFALLFYREHSLAPFKRGRLRTAFLGCDTVCASNEFIQNSTNMLKRMLLPVVFILSLLPTQVQERTDSLYKELLGHQPTGRDTGMVGKLRIEN